MIRYREALDVSLICLLDCGCLAVVVPADRRSP